MSRRLSRFQLSEASLSPQDGGLAMQRGLMRASLDGATAIAGPQPPLETRPSFHGSLNVGSLGADGIVFQISQNASFADLGYSLSQAGDVNGDGIDDFLVSFALPTNSGRGATFVVFGQDGGGANQVFVDLMAASEGFRINGASSYENSGASIAGAGDVNGDGFVDILIGAPNAGATSSSAAGAVYLVFGKASGFGTIDLATMTPADGFSIKEDASSNRLGWSVSFGDVNGDGLSDMIVGAPLTNNGAGAAYVVFGKASGLGNVDLTALSPTDGFTISGVAGSNAGSAVSGIGDLNGDGIEDFAVGAPLSDNPVGNAGALYVIFGRTSGLASLNLSAFSAADGFVIRGSAVNDQLPYSINSAGDVNGDGIDDLAVGLRGAAYVIYGNTSGFTDIDLSNLTPAQGFSIRGSVGSNFSIDSAGDFNGDGITDLIIGVTENVNNTDAGRAYILYGAAGGMMNVDLSRALVGTRVLTIFADSQFQNGHLGFAASAAGDFDNDGFADILVSASRNDRTYLIYGREADSPILGTPNAESLFGTAAGDDIRGLGGNDYLDGGSGADQLAGGQGDDVYAVEVNADLVIEAAGEGNDTVYTSADYVLPAGQSIEVLSARDVSSTDLLNLTGNELANILIGNNGKNTLNGGGGADALFGLGGDDRYQLRSAADQVFEGAGGGQDIVYVTFSYQLITGQSVETLVLDNFQSTFAADLIGNDLNNNIGGNAAANAIYGGAGDDGLFGYAGDDYLVGGDGVDYFEGGTGNDVFIVDNSAEIVRENVADQGSDRIFTSASYTIEANSSVELLAVIDNSTTSALQLTGNNLANTILGNNGDNVLSGMESADIIGGFGGNDMIDGGSGADYLEGGGGNDVIEGGTGADFMNGGAGDDTYYVDNAGDQVVEQPGDGNDVVYASITFALAAGASVETLAARDAAATTALAFSGNDGDNVVTGNAGANSLLGNGGVDTLNGLGGDDFLDGGTGSDIMIGGAGNDTFAVDVAGDAVTEAVGGGSDLVYTSVSYTLTAGQEIEVLAARDNSQTTALTLTGNDLANTILGNAGVNVIDGKGGNDTLQGYGGADTFAFTTALGAGNVDWIFGYSAVDDTISLDHNVFTGLTAGGLPASAFVIGTAAGDADDRIIYNSATGDIFFDADGNASGAAVLFAHLESAPTISASDFVVV